MASKEFWHGKTLEGVGPSTGLWTAGVPPNSAFVSTVKGLNGVDNIMECVGQSLYGLISSFVFLEPVYPHDSHAHMMGRA